MATTDAERTAAEERAKIIGDDPNANNEKLGVDRAEKEQKQWEAEASLSAKSLKKSPAPDETLPATLPINAKGESVTTPGAVDSPPVAAAKSGSTASPSSGE